MSFRLFTRSTDFKKTAVNACGNRSPSYGLRKKDISKIRDPFARKVFEMPWDIVNLSTMFARTLMTVLALLLGANCADAGLIVSPSVEISEPSVSAIESLLSDLMPLVDAEQSDEGVVNDDPSDRAGLSSNPISQCNYVSCGISYCGLLLAPGIAWYVPLSNASLPPSPVLTGLLKPS
jgi:hypothetical protein